MSPDRWPSEVANSARIDDSIPQKCLPSSSTTSTTTSTSTSSQNRCHSHFHHGVVGDRSVNYENDNKNKINNTTTIIIAIQPIANGQQNDGTCQLKESYIL
ncbi:hypothetical protein BLOT_003327 [Blomia tropicalis]|nr:hypothetical protein BLOT_003327 [Blomia tropicalis]